VYAPGEVFADLTAAAADGADLHLRGRAVVRGPRARVRVQGLHHDDVAAGRFAHRRRPPSEGSWRPGGGLGRRSRPPLTMTSSPVPPGWKSCWPPPTWSPGPNSSPSPTPPSWPAAKSLLSATGSCTWPPASPAAPANDGYASTPPGAGPTPSPRPGSASAPPSPNQPDPRPDDPKDPPATGKPAPPGDTGQSNTPQPRNRYRSAASPDQHPRTPPARKIEVNALAINFAYRTPAAEDR